MFLTRYKNQILQQNNPSCHCSNFTKKFISTRNIAVLPNYPKCSPDLNIMANIWTILKRNVQRRAAINLEELRHFVDEEFNKISDTVIVNLYDIMPRRISQILTGKDY